jgi:hypothetical protein
MVADVPGTKRITVGGDKGYDTKDFVQVLRDNNATPHVAQNNKNDPLLSTVERRGTMGTR